MWKKFIFYLALGSIAGSIFSYADDTPANSDTPNRSPAAAVSDEYAEENEYSFDWLDPDKKVYVLQNRRYTKANRALLTIMGGLAMSNPYRNGFTLEPRLAYYFNEQIGIEGFMTYGFYTENETYLALKDATGSSISVNPHIREVKQQMGGLLHWAPWYAKINVFNSVLYFDWYFTGGVGSVTTDYFTNAIKDAANTVSQSFFAVFFGTGHQYHLSRAFTVRLDFTGAMYSAPSRGTTGDSTTYTNYNFNLGFGVRF